MGDYFNNSLMFIKIKLVKIHFRIFLINSYDLSACVCVCACVFVWACTGCVCVCVCVCMRTHACVCVMPCCVCDSIFHWLVFCLRMPIVLPHVFLLVCIPSQFYLSIVVSWLICDYFSSNIFYYLCMAPTFAKRNTELLNMAWLDIPKENTIIH